MQDDALAEVFSQTWRPLAGIGVDEVAGGFTRLAWTAADAELRAWFAGEAARRGLDLQCDRNGNLWAWWGTPGPGAVVTGSHLDSVPGGGAFDGPLGIASALCAVDELRSRGASPLRPVAVSVFADEEGGRFGVACAGSRLMVGSLAPDRALALTDREGISLADAVSGAGLDPAALGPDETSLDRIGAFVELHIEQGRALGDLGAPVGVATGIWPHGRWRLSLHGTSDHAGTTRLADRADPVLALAAAVQAARTAAAALDALATIGRVAVSPGASNAVAAHAEGWLDARARDDETLDALLEAVLAATRSSATDHGVELEVVEESRSPAVAFDPALRDRVAAVVGGGAGAAPLLATGAGHDAGVLAEHVPTAMLFVRNPTGTSHSPLEHAEPADCLAGVRALADVLEDLACR